MKTIQIPGTAFPVSKICLGCAHMGTKHNSAESFAILDHYFEQGGRFLNTAHEYGLGKSEETLGQWIRSRSNRDQIILTTKGGEDYRVKGFRSMHREDLLVDMDESLTRLGQDHVDFYMLHIDDVKVGVDEILETMEELCKAGKTRHYGCSNWSPERQREAAVYAKAHCLQGFVIDEVEFNLAGNNLDNKGLNKWLDQNGIACHEESGMCVGAYSPLAVGALSKLVRDGDTRAWGEILEQWFDCPYTQEVARRIRLIQQETGWTTAQIQLAWLMNHPYRFPTFLIMGVSSIAQMDDALQAFDLTVTPEMIDYLRPDPTEFPRNTFSFFD